MTERPLNATAASLLGFLHAGPSTGWDLVVTAQQRIGKFWTLTQSQVYRELTAMAGSGLVEAGERGRRDRRPYVLTEKGRAAFADWVAADPGAETIRFPLLLTLAFGDHLPADRLAEMLRTHRATHAERLRSYDERLAEGDADPYARATLEFGRSYERGVLEWFDQLPAIVPVLAEGDVDVDVDVDAGAAEADGRDAEAPR